MWMTSNDVAIGEELEEMIKYYEARGQTVVISSINGIHISLRDGHIICFLHCRYTGRSNSDP